MQDICIQHNAENVQHRGKQENMKRNTKFMYEYK